VHEFSFVTEVYVIVLAGCDIILGIQWLVTLSFILWNYKDLTMEFTLVKKTIILQGLSSLKLLEET
jgi:hypothetical protein